MNDLAEVRENEAREGLGLRDVRVHARIQLRHARDQRGVDDEVDAALVSRVHCRLTLSQANELLLEDLDSTNGTYVNGEKVNKMTLTDGDKLTVGRVEFVVRSESHEKRTGDPKTTWSI